MAEDTSGTGSVKNEAKGASLPGDIETQIKTTIRSRIAYFKEQSDSLTFGGVRRLLELQTFALDVHKSFVKQCLVECLHDDNGSGETVDSNISTTSEPTKGDQSKKEVKQPCFEDEEKTKDSPVMEHLSEHKATKSESNETEPVEIKEVSEDELKKAIRKRAPYVEANSHYAMHFIISEKTTLADLLRLLEEDMKLDEHDLDPFKKFITTQLRKSLMTECSQSRESSNSSSKRNSDSPKHDNGVKDEEDWDKEEVIEISEEEEISGRKIDPIKNYEKSVSVLKRKKSEMETNALSEKRIRAAENVADNGIDAEEIRMVSEGDQIHSSSAVKVALFELTIENAKELAEEAKRQAEKAKEEADKSITSLKSKYVASMRRKNEELKTAKEIAEKAQRQAENAKKEAESANEDAKKSISAFKTKTENMERHIADLERQMVEARALASQAIDDLVGPCMEGAFHNFRMQDIADFPQLENRFKQYKLDFDMLIHSVETDDE